ncbi:hypothetical protein J4436_02560 [Candidatus Woesearchaeota archaeon]|nr:hypothetical protein [Candidatus Woesearchaeota archaeon]
MAFKKITGKRIRFIRQDSNKKKQFRTKWQKPRGMHSKIRLRKKGHPVLPNIGYGSKKIKSTIVYINNLQDLKKINNNEVIISSKLSARKKLIVLEDILKRNIKIINIKNPEKFKSDLLEAFNKRKTENKNKNTKRTQKKDELKTKEEPKKEETK